MHDNALGFKMSKPDNVLGYKMCKPDNVLGYKMCKPDNVLEDKMCKPDNVLEDKMCKPDNVFWLLLDGDPMFLFVKFKSQHLSVFQDWKHILLLATDYTGANKNTECLL